MAPTIATDSEGGDSSSSNDGDDEEGAVGGDVFVEGGVRLSREEDGGRDETMASAFNNLKMIDPRRKKIL